MKRAPIRALRKVFLSGRFRTKGPLRQADLLRQRHRLLKLHVKRVIADTVATVVNTMRACDFFIALARAEYGITLDLEHPKPQIH